MTREIDLRNLPGQPALRYRSGTHATIVERLLAALPTTALPSGPLQGQRPLEGLSAGGTPDAIPALIDAFAAAADVVTFYQERLVQEHYVRTATELRSLTALSGAVGYAPRPGVAAQVEVALTVDDAPGSPEQVEVPAGMKLQNIPAQGQRPQTFETSAPVVAHKAWNQITPTHLVAEAPKTGDTDLYLSGVNVLLQVGDSLLLVGDERIEDPSSERWEFRRVAYIRSLPALGVTRVTLDAALGTPLGGSVAPSANPRLYVLRQRAQLFGHNAPDWLAMPENIQQAYWADVEGSTPVPQNGYPGKEWPGLVAYDPAAQAPSLSIEGSWPQLLTPSWILLETGGQARLYRTTSAVLAARARFALSGKTTEVHLDTTDFLEEFQGEVRRAVVWLGAEELPLAGSPATDPAHPAIFEPIGSGTSQLAFPPSRPLPALEEERPVLAVGRRLRARVAAQGLVVKSGSVERTLAPGESLPLARWPDPWASPTSWWVLGSDGRMGQVLADTGAPPPAGALVLEPSLPSDAPISERTVLRLKPTNDGATLWELLAPLTAPLDRASLSLLGNVALASHGERLGEVLGSGDGSRPFQRFTLRRPHLTWRVDPTTAALAPDLEVTVDGATWRRVTSLEEHGPADRVFVLSWDEDGLTTLHFGDGIHGARLPTGRENVRASYRAGAGSPGLIAAGTLSLMTTRPLGIRSVTNPAPSAGALDPEGSADVREAAPRSTLTLGRVVSVTDFADFAQSFPGVGKAAAVNVGLVGAPRVLLTLAAPGGAAIDPTSLMASQLRTALDRVRDVRVPLELLGASVVHFGVKLRLFLEPDAGGDAVRTRARAALLAAFSFERRRFGQGVYASEVIAVVAAVPGVRAVDFECFLTVTGEVADPPFEMSARSARVVSPGGEADPAELLILSEAAALVDLGEDD